MKILKWGALVLGILLVIIVILVTLGYLITEQHRNETYLIETEPIQISYDEETLATGRHVATIRGCIDCHGENLGGDVFIEDPVVGLLIASNLTTGRGGIGESYTDEDLVKAIRHGVNKDNKSVIFMPSHEYNQIDSNDLAALIAYIRSVEPVDNELPDTKIGLPFRMMYWLGGDIQLFPARLIDHSVPIPEPVLDRTPVELGKYVAATCTGCHGAGYSGGAIPGVPPDWPEASNITLNGPLGSWTEQDFLTAMRTGVTPDGRELRNEYMPWQVFGHMTDEELTGLFAYLQSVEPREFGNR